MLSETIQNLLEQYGYLFFFLAFGLGPLGIPVPNEVTIITGAILTNDAVLNPWAVYGLILAGLLTATTAGYWLGKFFGTRILKKGNKKWKLALAKAQALFERYGNVAMVLGFFIPFVRYVVPIISGISGITFQKFMLFTYSGALLWTTIYFTLGKLFGDRIVELLAIVSAETVIITIVLLIILFFTFKKLSHRAKRRKRIMIQEQQSSPKTPPV